ncbi:MAG: ornithine--oxo-acid transaminase [Sphingobacteriales bacterium]|nr:ornithine--oxo-acid transaminase [Sphingobacteriales bacterium]
MSLSEQLISIEERYGAHNYHPIPVVLERGKGVYVWDVDGKRYFDFLSAYSAVNQGHSHPRILKALTDQAKKITLTSRAFYNSELGKYEEFVTKLFGYDKLLPMNSGAEAVETALKLCRKWAYLKKGIPQNEAVILFATGNFHGRTLAIISASTEASSRNDFGPYLPNLKVVEYGNLEAFKTEISTNKNIVGFFIEPIQGEAGIIIPEDDYLKSCAQICKENKVLFIADEIQTGIARTGKMLACDHMGIKPDMLILGKALSGGVLPVSAVLADDDIMLCIKPGEHGSTYGGNPLACAVATEALKVVIEEKLAENAEKMGVLFRTELGKVKSKWIKEIRGRGLLNALEINDTQESKTAWNICIKMAENGLLAKPTHGNIIRFAPPLVINEAQIIEAVGIIENSLSSID